MAIHKMELPKLGESIKEATLLKWLKKEGDLVEKDEVILEVATDKVDSEIVAPAQGVLEKILFKENEIVAVGQVIAKINTSAKTKVKQNQAVAEEKQVEEVVYSDQGISAAMSFSSSIPRQDNKGRFFSPLVRSIAKKEGITPDELQNIEGSGNNGRVLKKDIVNYLKHQTASPKSKQSMLQSGGVEDYDGQYEIIEMDRMRSMIADHMVKSVQTSPHVTSYVEADVTKIVQWRKKNKEEFYKKYGEKITFTPIFVEAVVKALQEFPLVNISIVGNKIIVKKDINIGLAAALPSGNLIVPVIKNADKKNLLGLTTKVNELVDKARNNKLSADEIRGSTFTISNVGTFRNIMGTPIINQPEVAILATGVIRKKPVVVETEYGDVITVRQMMYLSLSYDHRVVDGNLGGSFLARIMDHLEAFDENRTI